VLCPCFWHYSLGLPLFELYSNANRKNVFFVVWFLSLHALILRFCTARHGFWWWNSSQAFYMVLYLLIIKLEILNSYLQLCLPVACEDLNVFHQSSRPQHLEQCLWSW
jgi:hypothetical protein